MQVKRKEMREAGSKKPWGMQGIQTLHLISLFLKQMCFTLSLYSPTFFFFHIVKGKRVADFQPWLLIPEKKVI
jgi:hypothetical protein